MASRLQPRAENRYSSKMIGLRISAFCGGYAGNTPSASELHEPAEEDLKTYLPLMIEVGRKSLARIRDELELGKSDLPPRTLGALALGVDQIYRTLYDAFLKQVLLVLPEVGVNSSTAASIEIESA